MKDTCFYLFFKRDGGSFTQTYCSIMRSFSHFGCDNLTFVVFSELSDLLCPFSLFYLRVMTCEIIHPLTFWSILCSEFLSTTGKTSPLFTSFRDPIRFGVHSPENVSVPSVDTSLFRTNICIK